MDQKFSLGCEGVVCIPKKGKDAFVPYKTTFVKRKGKSIAIEEDNKTF